MNEYKTVADMQLTAPTRWLGLIAKILLPVALFVIAVIGATANPARAQTAANKIAADLQLSETGQPNPLNPNDSSPLGE